MTAALASLQIPVIWLMIPLFLAVMLFDLRQMRIPNALVLLVLVIAAVSLPLSVSLTEFGWRLLAAGIVLILGVSLFALRLMGGGDVKFLGALTLMIPTDQLAIFALLLSAAIFAGVAALYLARRAVSGSATRWRSLEDHSRYPLGLSIGLAGIGFALVAPILTGAI